MQGASSYAGLVDQAFWYILGVSALLLVGITAVMIGFAVRYSRKRNPNQSQIHGSVLLKSQDVIHSFFVPAFRVKEDAMPGRVNHAWFQSDKPGEYDLFCAEYCGDQHSQMLSKVRVLPAAEYAVWQANPPTVLAGPDLLAAKGCTSCHSLDGSRLVGPSFKALAGRRETVTSNGVGKEITVDEAYVRRSILEPKADLVKDFDPVMPVQRSQLTDEELDEIVRTLLGL